MHFSTSALESEENRLHIGGILMKKAFFALAIAFLASCAREYLFEEPREELKNEQPLWWVLQKKEP